MLTQGIALGQAGFLGFFRFQVYLAFILSMTFSFLKDYIALEQFSFIYRQLEYMTVQLYLIRQDYHRTCINIQIIEIAVMYQKESINNSFTNPFKRPSSNYIPQRSQTPTNLPSSNIGFNRQGKNNRSFTKLPNTGFQRPSQPYYQKPVMSNNISRSRISVQSSSSQLAFLNTDQGNIFPEDLIFLLKNQQKNINNFKDKIQKQKSRVENDFAVFKTQIQHILQDVKISLQAQLDLVYKTFITKYAQLKGQVQQLRTLRKQILMNNISSNKYFNSLNTTSNKDIVGQIEKDAEQFKNYKVYGYLSELQKQKLTPILGLTTDIILIGSADCPFYRNKEMNGKLKELRGEIGDLLTDIYGKLHDYITTPQAIIQRQKQQEQNANMILNEMNNQPPNFNAPQNILDPHYPNNYSNLSIGVKKHQQALNLQQKFVNMSMGQQQSQNITKPSLQYISPNQQCTVVKYGENVSFNHKERIVTDHQDSILCVFFVNEKFIATGSKDKTINIYSISGEKVTTLRGHTASICCLSMIRNLSQDRFLASGSDHGCSSLILWDTRNWQMQTKVTCHTAAVTSIVDLEDGRHLVTGSYDKKINLFSHAKGKVLSSLNNNKTSVTSMIMTSDKARLVSSGLDNSLSVWTIVRKNQVVQSIIPQMNIANDSLICQLQPCILRPEQIFAATRNGQIKLLNTKTGQPLKTLVVNSNSIIQLVTIEREMKPDGPFVLSCSSKDNSLVLTKMDTTMSSLMKLKYNTGIEFGCGIGPKVVFSQAKGGMVAVLNQTNTSREFNIYEVEVK